MTPSAVLSVLGALALGCGPVELRLGNEQGLRPIRGSANATTDAGAFTCGNAFTGSDPAFTVTTATILGGCAFTFDRDVEVIAVADYGTVKELSALAPTLDRVELDVRRLDFSDGDGTRFVVGERIHELELWVNGQQVMNVEEAEHLPMTVVLKGEALEQMKRAVKRRASVTAHVVSKVVVRDAATVTGVRCEYDVQPTLVLSTAAL